MAVSQQITADGVSMMVPEGWQQVSGENTWSPDGSALPQIGVSSAPLNDDWRPSSFLPEGGMTKSTELVLVGGGQVNMYTVQNADGTAEIHAIAHSGEMAYDYYARAASLEEVRALRPMLEQVIESATYDGM